jgi:3-hydroxybutyrate dehydrogenase
MANRFNIDLEEPIISREEVLVVKDKDFNSKNVALVTGATSGLGKATAVAMAVNGVKVVCSGTNIERGHETVNLIKNLGGEAIFVRADLTKDDEIEHCVEEAASYGQIKYLANIAGIQHIDSVENFPMEAYDTMQKINLRAPLYLAKLCLPHMKASDNGIGVVGNMSSQLGHIATKLKPAYSMTKFGIRGLTQAIAAEGEGKIRSFSVSVGFCKTPIVLKQIPAQAKQRGVSEGELVENIMLSRSQVKDMMTPIEVANLFVVGFSKMGKYLIGADLLFDGGAVRTW